MGGILSNCGGVTGPLTNTFEQSVAVGNTWSVGADLGIDFGPLKIGGNYDWSTTETVTISQTIEFQVQPGEMGVLVAVIEYAQTPGSMTVGDQVFPAIYNHPINVVGYVTEIVSCGGQFTATNISSMQNCTSSAPMYLKGSVPSILDSLVLMIVMASLLTRLSY